MRYLFGFLCVCALGVMPLVGCSSGGTGIPCEDDVDCPDDSNACTEDYCENNGMCVYTPIECDADFNDCTVEMCDPAVGCGQSPVADGTQCAGGTCQAGVCELAGSVLPCSEQGIRNAIAAGGDEPYTFDCDGTTPVVISATIGIDNNVILDGEGNLTVTDSSFNPIVVVEEEVAAELRGLTIIGGAPLPLPSEKIGMFPPGSGILNNGTLTLTNSTVSNKPGSGISNGGTLAMTNCTVSGNTGFIGGIDNGGMLTMTNSTVSGNTGTAGGILNNGTLTMTNSTLSGNMANEPENERSAIVNGENATLTAANNLVDGSCGNSGVITSNGYNIESPDDTCGFDQQGDQSGVSADDLNLGELAGNGGPTMTLKPGDGPFGSGSAAIDQIPEADCAVTTDQRGEPRPVAILGLEPKCDVGSVEVQP